MSEHLPHNHEAPDNGEKQPNPYGERTVHHEAPAHQPEHGRNRHEIEELIKKVEHEATRSGEVQKHIENSRSEHDRDAGAHIKAHASPRQALKSVQRQLSMPERQLSKIIHNPTVETISDATGATIARPSGLLVGGVFSLLASIGVLFVCRFYGYEYNYGIGLMFLVGGFALGLLLEMLSKLFTARR